MANYIPLKTKKTSGQMKSDSVVLGNKDKIFRPFKKNARLSGRLQQYLWDANFSASGEEQSSPDFNISQQKPGRKKSCSKDIRNNQNCNTAERNIDSDNSDNDMLVNEDISSMAKSRVNISLQSAYSKNETNESMDLADEIEHSKPTHDTGIKPIGLAVQTPLGAKKLGKTDVFKQTNKISTPKKAPLIKVEQSSVMFSDVGGLEATLSDICMLLVHLKHPEIHQTIGVSAPRGLLLHGPPGCGKTLIAHAIAGELKLPFIKVAATELVSGVSGKSESKIRELFDSAISSAPCILFIDEIDAITPKREFAQREMEIRIVAQLLNCMDELNMKDAATQVLVIGATNRPDSLDPALRRAGRFDREISVGMPDEAARLRILKVVCRQLRLPTEFDFHWLAKNTPGYVGADLMSVTREAANIAIGRIFGKYMSTELSLEEYKNTNSPKGKEKQNTELNELQNKTVIDSSNGAYCSELKEPVSKVPLTTAISWLKDQPPFTEDQLKELFVEVQDFEAALQVYLPSAKREGFATIPNVTWSDIGGLNDVQETLQTAILWPVKYRQEFENFHLSAPTGILLCGPKGCGKTLLAKAVANECSINFLSVKGPELLNMYVGESERAVRRCFERARNSAPCVIFFDEIDALCPPRSRSNENAAAERVVNQLLTEIDGTEGRKQIFVMGATNRPDNIDSAMLRPGRFEQILFIDLPTSESRLDILKAITKNGTKPKFASDVNFEALAMDNRCEGFSGADLKSLVTKASLIAFKDYVYRNANERSKGIFEISSINLETALLNMKPSVSEKDRQYFKKMKSTL